MIRGITIDKSNRNLDLVVNGSLSHECESLRGSLENGGAQCELSVKVLVLECFINEH